MRGNRRNGDMSELATGDANIGARGDSGVPQRLDMRIVIDPSNTIAEKSTLFKQAAVTQFTLRPGVATELASSGVSGSLDRVMVEVASACVGLRVSSGSAGACEGGDMDIVVEDVGSARYALKSISGIADLGIVDPAVADSSGAHFGQNVVPIAGHTYAVQLSGGKVAVFKISAILSPSQLAAIANKRFNRAG